MLGRPVGWRIAVAVATPLALWATWGLAAAAWPSTLDDHSGLKDLVVCNVMTLVFASRIRRDRQINFRYDMTAVCPSRLLVSAGAVLACAQASSPT